MNEGTIIVRPIRAQYHEVVYRDWLGEHFLGTIEQRQAGGFWRLWVRKGEPIRMFQTFKRAREWAKTEMEITS